MVDFLIVASKVKTNDFLLVWNNLCKPWILKHQTLKIISNLGFVEGGGVLPLEVGAVPPEAGLAAGGVEGGDGDGVVHHAVLVRQDVSAIK